MKFLLFLLIIHSAFSYQFVDFTKLKEPKSAFSKSTILRDSEYIELKMYEESNDGVTWMTSKKSLAKNGLDKVLSFRTKSFVNDVPGKKEGPEDSGYRVEIF